MHDHAEFFKLETARITAPIAMYPTAPNATSVPRRLYHHMRRRHIVCRSTLRNVSTGHAGARDALYQRTGQRVAAAELLVPRSYW
eukprot:3934622-Rhodomonas_salina.1